jgi:hypothetical protein
MGRDGKAGVAGPRLKAVPPGQMCEFKLRISSPSEVDAELLGWLRAACDAAR